MPEAVPVSGRVRKLKVYAHVNTVSQFPLLSVSLNKTFHFHFSVCVNMLNCSSWREIDGSGASVIVGSYRRVGCIQPNRDQQANGQSEINGN